MFAGQAQQRQYTYTPLHTRFHGGMALLVTDGRVRKTEAKLSSYKDRMDTENIDKKKLFVKKKRRGRWLQLSPQRDMVSVCW
jgi:hypothetical protein